MPPESRDPAHLWDMLEVAKAAVASLKSVDFPDYLEDEELKLVTERRPEIIGEAARAA